MNRQRRSRSLWLVLLVMTVLSVGNAQALTDEEIFREFRFNFLSPGAHALGLGGAYISAASDATASVANPAALRYVNKNEIFFEFRSTMPESSILRPSAGVPFGNRTVGSDEDFTDFAAVNNREDGNLASFVSYVRPFKLKGRRARLALSRQIVLDNETSLSLGGDDNTTLAVSLQDFPTVNVSTFPDPPSIERYTIENEVEGFLDAELVNYNLSFSISLTRDFTLGLNATMAELSMDSQVNSVARDPFPVLNSVNPRVGGPGFVSDIQRRTTIDDETDTDVTFSVGLLWHPDSVFADNVSPFRFGLVYRQGAELAVEERIEEFDAGSATFTDVPDGLFDNVLRVPDRLGIGGSFHGQHWLFTANVERIQYSDLLEGFRPGVNFFTSDLFPSTLLDVGDDLLFDVDDATVVRGGIEYSFVSRGNWSHSISVGYFNSPDNKIALTGIDSGDPDLDAIFKDLFRAGEDFDHYTVGFGVSTPKNFGLRLAGDFSDEGDQIVASTIIRFGDLKTGK